MDNRLTLILIRVGIVNVATLDCNGHYRGDAIAEGFSYALSRTLRERALVDTPWLREHLNLCVC